MMTARWFGAGVAVLALTFSYAAVAALLPTDIPEAPMMRAVSWTVVVLAVYAAYIRSIGRSFSAAWALPRTWWSLGLIGITAGTTVAALLLPSPDRTTIDLVRIMIVAVIGEEVVFRGLVWDIVRTAAHTAVRRPELVTLFITSALFAISHLQYHEYSLSAELLGQLGYRFAAGLLLGWARSRTRGIAVPILLHVTGNALLKLGGALL